jgi:hypothetical protein
MPDVQQTQPAAMEEERRTTECLDGTLADSVFGAGTRFSGRALL